ncbi:MAG: bifunctional DNA primase/polymerase [Anaerolineae bacterium]|nr:bifunctional DNA primase/polymerase [Anaerolineae bacterium]
MNLLDIALDYHRQGLTPIPFETGTKNSPVWGGWKQYQHILQTTKEVQSLFDGLENANIALIGGVKSQNGYPFFLDCDNRAKAEAFNNRIAGLGIKTWEVQRDNFAPNDPHGGGQHFYFLADSPIKSGVCEFGEVRGCGAIVIAPYSRHPTGATYLFKTKPNSIFKLDDLATIPELQLAVANEAKYRRDLPRLAWRLLQGDLETISKYSTRSEAEAALCASLIRAGFGFGEISAFYIAHPGTGKFSELYSENQENGQRYLYHTYQNVREYLKANANEAEAMAQKLRGWAMSHPWPGRTGATDKAVYLAHLSIVSKCGKLSYAASIRELAELAGISWKTATNANHRLAKAGLLDLEKPATASLSNVWSIVDIVSSLPTQSTQCDGVCNYDNLQPQYEHDAFRWSGLGKTGADIYYKLQELTEASVNDLVIATGRGRKTVYRKLDLMDRSYMAEKIGGGLWKKLEVNLDAVAEMLGTSGKGELERQKHIQERRWHKLVLKRGENS